MKKLLVCTSLLAFWGGTAHAVKFKNEVQESTVEFDIYSISNDRNQHGKILKTMEIPHNQGKGYTFGSDAIKLQKRQGITGILITVLPGDLDPHGSAINCGTITFGDDIKKAVRQMREATATFKLEELPEGKSKYSCQLIVPE